MEDFRKKKGKRGEVISSHALSISPCMSFLWRNRWGKKKGGREGKRKNRIGKRRAR